MSRPLAISREWALATDDAQGWRARAPRPAAARSALSLVNRSASRAPADGAGVGVDVSAEAGTAAPPSTSARGTAGPGQILRREGIQVSARRRGPAAPPEAGLRGGGGPRAWGACASAP